MTGNVADVAILLKAFGIGIPVGIVVCTFLIVTIVIKFVGAKQDKDRSEHIEKWNSMIEVQRESISRQSEATTAVIASNERELNRIIAMHNEVFERLYKQYETRSQQMDVICHNLTTMSKILETKHFCPNQLKG